MFEPLQLHRRRLVVSVVLLTLLAFYVAPLAGAAPTDVIIDHFDTAQGPLSATLGGGPQASFVSGGNILGTERDMQVTVTSGSPGVVKIQALNSELLHSQDSGIIGQSLIQWDGVDGVIALDPNGLGGVDLTEGNVQNGLEITVLLNDLPIDLIFTAYSGANSSTYTLALPGGQGQSSGEKVYYVPFAAFTTLAGSGANFASLGALELLIDGFEGASDLTLHEIRTVDFDWGDLPDSSVGGPNYPTRFADDGPRHVIGELFLGAQIDAFEMNGIPSVGATGDDLSGVDDEDGVVRTPAVLWQGGVNGGSVDVTVTGGDGCLSGWIDWNGNGNLLDAGDNILSNVAVGTGVSTHTFFIPAAPGNGTFYARFRLFARDPNGSCTTPKAPTGAAVNGEVEDYQWSFGPNAVNLSGFSGSSGPATLPVIGAVIATLSAGFVALRRVAQR